MREIREIGFERNRVTDFENRAILRCSHANGALPPPFVSKKKKVSNFSYRLSTGELKFALKKKLCRLRENRAVRHPSTFRSR